MILILCCKRILALGAVWISHLIPSNDFQRRRDEGGIWPRRGRRRRAAETRLGAAFFNKLANCNFVNILSPIVFMNMSNKHGSGNE